MAVLATLRTFIAIELPDSLRERLAAVIDRLSASVPRGAVRWVQPDNIHLTLKFLGDMPVSQGDQVIDLIGTAAQGTAPFECLVTGLGCFPNLRQPRVVWAGLREASGSLERLQRILEAGALRLGYAREPEERGFNPHLTLGRLGRQAGAAEARRVGEAVQAAAAGAGDLGSLPVEAVSLMKSELRPGGSIYTRLFQARLGALTSDT